MTPSDYRLAGFDVSLQLEQAVVERAERDVIDAYISPIFPDVDPENLTYAQRDAIMSVSFLLLLQRNVKATRSGAKIKTSDKSMQAEQWDVLHEGAKTAAMKLQALTQQEGATKHAIVNDICGIYFQSEYFNNQVKL